MNVLALCAFISDRLNDDEARARKNRTWKAAEEFTFRGRTVTLVGFRTNSEEGRVLVVQDARAPQQFEIDEAAAAELYPQIRITEEAQRTLREVAAKRVILANFNTLLESEATQSDATQHALAHMMKVGVLAPIASVYEDHPDFRAEWNIPLHQFESDARAHAFIREQRKQALRYAEVTQTPLLWLP